MTTLTDLLAILRAVVTGGDPIAVHLERWQGRAK